MATKSTKAPTTQVCAYEVSQGASPQKARKKLTKENFSLVKGQEGVFHKICRKCRVILSKQWTDNRADLRKLQATARAINAKAGKDLVRIPLAKDVVQGQPLPALRYANGKIFRPNASRAKSSGASATATA